MNKLILLILICFTTSFSQGWVQQNGPFSEKDVTHINFINSDTGFVIIFNELWKTTDGGNELTKIFELESGRFCCSFYIDSVLIIVGKTILRSTDLGVTFTSSNVEFNPAGASFVTSSTGWIADWERNLWKTTNGGSTWVEQFPPLSAYNVFFINENIGYLTSGNNPSDRFGKTTNGGATWFTVQIPGLYFKGHSIIFYNELIGYIGPNRTTDGGNTWVAGPYYGDGFGFRDNTALIYESQYVKSFYISHDLGENWQKYFRPTGEWSAMTIIDSLTFIYGDYNAAIYKTTNRGDTWNCLTSHAFPLYSGYFINDNIGWITGRGNLLKTTNGGIEWNPIYTPLNNLSNIVFVNAQKGFGFTSYYLGNSQYRTLLLKTTNGGVNWDSVAYLPGNTYRGQLKIYDSTFIYGITFHGYLYTTNGGDTWITDSVSGVKGFDIHFPTRTTGYITGEPGFKTTDGGITWIQRSSLIGRSVFFLDSLRGWKGDGWVLYRTTNGGVSFILIMDHGQSHEFERIKFFNADQGIMSDDAFYQVWRSANGGVHWNSEQNVPYHHFNRFNLGWAFGDEGQIYKYEYPVPVELISFIASSEGNNVFLSWAAASEINNKGYEIERKQPDISNEWLKIGFVEGSGTTAETVSYQFIDQDLTPGSYKYRLRQLDLDGGFEYSIEIAAVVKLNYSFYLEQNYPNPFNPVTRIRYQVPESGRVTIQLYDILGKEVKLILDDIREPGIYDIALNAAGLASGIYFYQMRTGKYSAVKKLIVAK